MCSPQSPHIQHALCTLAHSKSYPVNVVMQHTRCHGHEGGAKKANCMNQKQPFRLPNPHNFPAEEVDIAAKLINRWFEDTSTDDHAALGMCRVTALAGHTNDDGKKEAVMWYSYIDANGELQSEYSSLAEVHGWVQNEESNL